jgi:hypothetical protein
MKVTLEFTLPEQTDEYISAMDGAKLSAVVSETLSWLRQKSKYENFETLPVDEVRQKIYELLEEYGVQETF